jgi:molecular chaperone DnaK (HSP70)
MQAAREMGLNDATVLVDITPYSFGTSALGIVDGEPCMTKFVPMIRRNTKLPARRSEVFGTIIDNQKAVDVQVFQGEEPDAADNVMLGNYMFNLTQAPAGSQITLHFDLDLNGILKIKAVEKHTGKHINAVIENALPGMSEEGLTQTRDRIDNLWPQAEEAAIPPATGNLPLEFAEIIHRAEQRLDSAAQEDREDIVNLIEDIRDALKSGDMNQARGCRDELDDLLFYLDA